MGAATLLGLAGIVLAYTMYVHSPGLADRVARRWHQAYRLSLNKWYVDEAYDRTVVRPTFTLADRLWQRIDVNVIDGAVNGIARGFAWWGWFMRLIQSGQTQHYALGMALGAVVILTAYLLL
jgi:NADH-quinone oxidoreductase subunit L